MSKLANQIELRKAKSSAKLKCPYCSETFEKPITSLLVATIVYHLINSHSKEAFVEYAESHNFQFNVPLEEIV
jgi:hypothetical protein